MRGLACWSRRQLGPHAHKPDRTVEFEALNGDQRRLRELLHPGCWPCEPDAVAVGLKRRKPDRDKHALRSLPALSRSAATVPASRSTSSCTATGR